MNEENSNTSSNPTFDSVLQARLSRRGLLRGFLGECGLGECGSDGGSHAAALGCT